ncbi:MAG TPA: substrate-binding domain-containing protein [Burkholderiaceae bacterium]|nr:substrate-binding domain-containing protein [Burkholderiaceae bacterium]
MKLRPDVAWRGEHPLDARLLPLLRGVRDQGTLREAADSAGMSYRSAWDLLAAQSLQLGAPLVAKERGRGSTLSALGERLVAADDALRRELARLETRLAIEIGDAATAAAPLRIAASHDLLLAALCERLDPAVDLQFKGSLESLEALARGDVELGGFHVGGRVAGATAAPQVLRRLDARRHRLVRFASREQGLMLAAGNPKDVRTIADVARKELLFVNRQRGSGTRLLLERLLAEADIRPAQLRGYGTEEYTHAAVAATIAAGHADAGLGVEAAARQFGLAFVPLRQERYWFALQRGAESSPRVQAFLRALRGQAFRRLARSLAGYDARGAGQLCDLNVLPET